MGKYLVADSYKNFEQIGEPFENEKGNMVIKVKETCPRCGGLGIIVSYVENGVPIPVPVDGGVCYKCGGAKTITKTVRVYDEKEHARLQAQKDRARKRREEAAAAKKKELIDNAEIYKHELALKLGFNEDEKIYIIYGDDTYSIKGTLKKQGARFNPVFKWYVSNPIDLPEGYGLCEISFDEIYNYVPEAKRADIKEDADKVIRKRITELKGPSTSIFYPGTEKERIRNITVRLSGIRGFLGNFGYTHIYTFKADDYVFVWMTSKALEEFSIGETVDLTGTIKKFEEYDGVKNTYLTRCIVKAVD